MFSCCCFEAHNSEKFWGFDRYLVTAKFLLGQRKRFKFKKMIFPQYDETCTKAYKDLHIITRNLPSNNSPIALKKHLFLSKITVEFLLPTLETIPYLSNIGANTKKATVLSIFCMTEVGLRKKSLAW